ncbi:hypothetical protein [Streptomyces ardesiacus]|uniref:hypothetical protein n=1 Tax=Streptomyces ardesiacus TaxID=285564 RepID=UPI00340544C7
MPAHEISQGTHDWVMRLEYRAGNRMIGQEFQGQYKVPPGETHAIKYVMSEIRHKLAPRMGVHVSQTVVAAFRITP